LVESSRQYTVLYAMTALPCYGTHLCGVGVGGEEPPVDVAPVPQVGVVRVLRRQVQDLQEGRREKVCESETRSGLSESTEARLRT
jgi:hypothetical protein